MKDVCFLLNEMWNSQGGIELTSGNTDVIHYLYIPLNNDTLNAYFYFVNSNGSYATGSLGRNGSGSYYISLSSYSYLRVFNYSYSTICIDCYNNVTDSNGTSSKITSTTVLPVSTINQGQSNSNYRSYLRYINPSPVVYQDNSTIYYIKIDATKLFLGSASSDTVYQGNGLYLKLKSITAGSNIYYEPYSA